MSMVKIKIKCLSFWEANAGPTLMIRLPFPSAKAMRTHILAGVCVLNLEEIVCVCVCVCVKP